MTETSFKFTEARLKTLPVPLNGTRATYRDAEVKGLELRITSNGVKSFSWYRRPKNEAPQRVTIGRSPDVSVGQARAEAQKYNAAIATGESPASERRAKRNEMLFSDLFTEYMQRHAKTTKKTWKGDQQLYDLHVAARLGRLRLTQVTRDVVSKLHFEITTKGHPAVANRVLALISSVFGRAVEWSIVEVNPVRGIRRNKETSRDRFLDSQELPRFLSALQAEPKEVLRNFFLMLLFTGARRGNVLPMAWGDINLDSAVWRIPETKNGESLNVPLIPAALEMLKRLRNADPAGRFVFPGTGESGHIADPKKAWKRIFDRDELSAVVSLIEAAGGSFIGTNAARPAPAFDEPIEQALNRAKAQAGKLKIDVSTCRMPQTRIHDLRRTMGSWQAASGASLNIIGKSLGHKNIATTAIYARVQMDPVREAMTKAATAMFSGQNLALPILLSKD